MVVALGRQVAGLLDHRSRVESGGGLVTGQVDPRPGKVAESADVVGVEVGQHDVADVVRIEAE